MDINLMLCLPLCIVIGFILDLIFGDPMCIPHPIIYIGKLISFFDKQLYGIKNKLFGGALMTTLVCIICLALSAVCEFALFKISVYLLLLIEIFWVFQILASKSLYTESMKVYHAMKNSGIEEARVKLSYIVGRDTRSLSESEVIAAAVETVAENTSDGVTAPLMYIALGGAPLGFFYKAVNTLDSMVGYKTDRYILFGRPSAKMDDFMNFIPSRICATLMICSAKILGYDAANAFYIFKRDRKNHLSPNSAQTEAVAAGAMGIQLGGTHSYFGKLVEKPTIGDKTKEIEWDDLKKVNRMMIVTSILSAAAAAFIRLFVLGVLNWAVTLI